MTCPHCTEAVAPGEATRQHGWHDECILRAVIGSVAHIEKRCTCYNPEGADDGDPDGMTPREAARAAVAAWQYRTGLTLNPDTANSD